MFGEVENEEHSETRQRVDIFRSITFHCVVKEAEVRFFMLILYIGLIKHRSARDKFLLGVSQSTAKVLI